MKYVLLGLLAATPTFAFDAGYTRYKATVCYDEAFEDCEKIEDRFFQSQFPITTYYAAKSSGKKKGGGLGHLVDSVIYFTGMSFGKVKDAIKAIHEECVNHGYTQFKAELSGPAGSVAFTYQMQSGAFTVSHLPAQEPSVSKSATGRLDKTQDEQSEL